MAEKVRLQFELSKIKSDRLDELMVTCHVSTKKDLLNNALTLLEWAVKERKEGYEIASVNHEKLKIRDLRMPILNDIQSSLVE